ncbi:MAG: hypothetical protein ISR59_03960 [Anaerolineales bacterium]|uniref:Uncharacterized protein n=1 Tax=Candidatus Desulfolinea nitratireducens TaxID=2841698 RepID=A0A8J6NIR6_9CHLR|nr:hypothetical protein [Candidatus Desulfolinea nitratireducens]MBL6960240.1 hypothetical protein [Anaerolineales bacterium]
MSPCPFLIVVDSADGGSAFYTFYIGSNDNYIALSEFDVAQNVEWGGYDISKSYSIRHNQWYTFRFELDQSTLSFYVDDKLASTTEANLPLVRESGGIGFYIGGNEEVHLDDIKVWSLSEQDTPAHSTEAAASLVSNKLIRPCEWDVRINLTGFEPNSVITVSSNYSETVCSDGSQVTSAWTVDYQKKTDALGNLVTSYLHKGTGDYNYSYVDEKGNRASLSFSTEP